MKTDIAKAGAAAAIEALSPEESVGVVAVAGGAEWLLPLQRRPDPDTVEEALAPIAADGDTELARGLSAALEELQGVDGALRHIVLFTDGWDPNEANLVPLARQIADAGITLSVLGTGEAARLDPEAHGRGGGRSIRAPTPAGAGDLVRRRDRRPGLDQRGHVQPASVPHRPSPPSLRRSPRIRRHPGQADGDGRLQIGPGDRCSPRGNAPGPATA